MAFLRTFSLLCSSINRRVGRVIAWLTLAMVVVQFCVVFLRYIFGYGSIFMQESIFYMHALLFILGAGFTLCQDGHVRVDIFYQSANLQHKALINLLGTLFFLLPFCVVLIVVTIPYATQSWAVLEGSRETSGIPAVYLLKSTIFAFCGLLILQGLSLASSSLLTLFGEPLESNTKHPTA